MNKEGAERIARALKTILASTKQYLETVKDDARIYIGWIDFEKA